MGGGLLSQEQSNGARSRKCQIYENRKNQPEINAHTDFNSKPAPNIPGASG